MVDSRAILPPLILSFVVLSGAAPGLGPARRAADAPPARADRPDRPLDVRLDAAAFGRSGALRVTTALPGATIQLPLEWSGARPSVVHYRWIPVAADPNPGLLGAPVRKKQSRALESRLLADGGTGVAPAQSGVYKLRVEAPGGSRVFDRIRLLVLVPFHKLENGYIGDYFIGRYPEVAPERRDEYPLPTGFLRVTKATRHLRLSEHFRVSEFLTHDQDDVWPKYVVIQPRLLDKLELVLDELQAMGIRAEDMVVMSGYRTPQYNRQGLDAGRARLSRHQYGDAADVWIDSDGDWYMDDLNGDGERDTDDARVVLRAVNRVEARYPDLVGGAGVYDDNGVHGPFIHIDARGWRARW